MICYASRTGTKRNLAALKAACWRLLVSRAGVWRTEGFRYGLDNGRWTDSQQDPPRPFDAQARAEFMRLVTEFGPGADFIVIPDTVGDRAETLDLLAEWLPRLRALVATWPARGDGEPRRLLIAVQDGMTPADVEPFIGPDVGIFLGGSTAWKLATMRMWGEFCAKRGLYFHVARVNTVRRFRMAHAAGADSVDGSSAARYAMTLSLLDGASRQPDLLSPRRAA